MIKIDLTEEFLKDKEVDKIFDEILEKIFSEKIFSENKRIKYKYCNQSGDKEFKNSEEIKSFLMAKDFYNYEINPDNQKILSDYDKLDSKNRHKLLVRMNHRVCPYCNMNYIVSYYKEEKGNYVTTADLDHFYPKEQYPAYTLCLYNFVPSCSMCNRRLKLRNKVTKESYVFPHEESFEGKAKFRVPNLLNAFLNNEDVEITLDIYDDEDGKVKNSAKVFRTEEIYQSHKVYAQELFDKVRLYNEAYVEELDKLLNVDVKVMVFGDKLSESGMGKVSLGKLKRDLLNEFEIY